MAEQPEVVREIDVLASDNLFAEDYTYTETMYLMSDGTVRWTLDG